MIAKDHRHPRRSAKIPPVATPSTEPKTPPAVNMATIMARMDLGNTLTTTARPTLP